MEKLQSLVVRELHHQVGKTFLQIGQLVLTGHQVPVEVRDQLKVLGNLQPQSFSGLPMLGLVAIKQLPLGQKALARNNLVTIEYLEIMDNIQHFPPRNDH